MEMEFDDLSCPSLMDADRSRRHRSTTAGSSSSRIHNGNSNSNNNNGNGNNNNNNHNMPTALLHNQSVLHGRELIQTTQSCASLPSNWHTTMTLKSMKILARRSNCPSSWQTNEVRRKADMVNLLREKVVESKKFVRTVRRFTFGEYVEMGLTSLGALRRVERRKRKQILLEEQEEEGEKDGSRRTLTRSTRNYRCGSEKPQLETEFEIALEAAVHIIPSGSGAHIGKGFILTCDHCVVHDDDDHANVSYNSPASDRKVGRVVELMTARGKMFGAVCVASCETTDLALLYIITANKPLSSSSSSMTKECARPTSLASRWEPDQLELDLKQDLGLGCLKIGPRGSNSDGTDIFALGNPCDIDLESIPPDDDDDDSQTWKNGFFPFHASKGKLVRKISENSIARKQYGLGRQIHDAWTYWGHSGCPLVAVVDGYGNDNGSRGPCIVGVHNSWNDTNGNRHGVTLEEISFFLETTAGLGRWIYHEYD